MKNPFEEQAQFYKKEAHSWRKRSIVVGIIGFIIFLLLFTCNK